MSSNIRINKVCQHCNKVFIAKTTVTKFCSDQCAKSNYKKRQKDARIEVSQIDTERQLSEGKQQIKSVSRDSSAAMVGTSGLSAVTGLSERTIFRLIKDPAFPRVKIGKRLLFKKDAVIDYLTSKYGNL
ncbi:MAG: helix-turn-helix domain-containing protein [Williamsia sp.]|nr:helix-turn-helix domain-containing protein [Williamsia sp.]